MRKWAGVVLRHWLCLFILSKNMQHPAWVLLFVSRPHNYTGVARFFNGKIIPCHENLGYESSPWLSQEHRMVKVCLKAATSRNPPNRPWSRILIFSCSNQLEPFRAFFPRVIDANIFLNASVLRQLPLWVARFTTFILLPAGFV